MSIDQEKKTLLVSQENQILTITLNRPEKHNAFDPKMIQEITDLFLDLNRRTDIRAVVLQGAGASFSAGGDLEWMKSMVNYTFKENQDDAKRLFDMYQAMALCEVPLIGKVHGNVMGGGLGMVAVCDIVISEAQTQFCFSEVKIGIAPAVISSWVLKKTSQGFLREVMMTGRVFSAQESQHWGLVHFIETIEGLQPAVEKVIQNILKAGPEAVRATKRILNEQAHQSYSLLEIREKSSRWIAERRSSSEGQDGLKSFLEKKKPNWIQSANRKI